MNIILIGYRGCGKTSIGKSLAAKLWKTFIDVDDEICKRFNNKTVAQIWTDEGEPAYRKVEVEVTRELVARPNMVIGLGGGTLMQAGAREAVEQAPNTVRVYLRCAPEELHKRISGDAKSAATRPALTKFGGGIDEIKHMLAERGPVYEAVADKVLDVSHLPIDGAVKYLLAHCV
ncbi:MAG: shikimate kinase [Planctomycetes bacterium]|nr:shikimate kinase [Planctomycetota bacterium]